MFWFWLGVLTASFLSGLMVGMSIVEVHVEVSPDVLEGGDDDETDPDT